MILGTGIVTKVYDEIEKHGINVVSKAEQTAILKNNETGMRKTMRIFK